MAVHLISRPVNAVLADGDKNPCFDEINQLIDFADRAYKMTLLAESDSFVIEMRHTTLLCQWGRLADMGVTYVPGIGHA